MSWNINISPDVDFRTDLTSWEISDHWQLLLTSPRAAGAQCLQRRLSEFSLKIGIWKFDLRYLKAICPAFSKVMKNHALKLKITRSPFWYLFYRNWHASNALVWGILPVFCLLLQCFKLLRSTWPWRPYRELASVCNAQSRPFDVWRSGLRTRTVTSCLIFPGIWKIALEVGNYPHAKFPRMKVLIVNGR